MAVKPRQHEEDRHSDPHHQNPRQLVGDGPQNCIVRREVPHRCNVLRRLERIGGNEVRMLEEPAAKLRCPEHDHGEQYEEERSPHNVLDRVVGVERNSVHGYTVRVLVLLYLNPIGIVRTRVVQRMNLGSHEPEQYDRQCHDMQ